MKTGSPSTSHVGYRHGAFILLAGARYVAALSLVVVAGFLICYSAVANARRAGAYEAANADSLAPEADDRDPEYLEKRREFLNRFFGNGPDGVSRSAYTNALEAARALPASELTQSRKFFSAETMQMTGPWISPVSPPIQNSYGGNASAQVHAMAVDPMNANVVYTGSFGGLAKTTDSGVTWRYLSDAWSSQAVSSIAINPNASTDVYVGTGRDEYGPYGVGLFRSFDGGATWSNPLGSAQFSGNSIRTIAIDSNSGAGLTATLYVASGGANNCGLWRSTDSGQTWTRLRQMHNGAYDVAIDSSTHPAMLYLTEDRGTFKSTDSGASWAPIHAVLTGSQNRLRVVNSALYLLGPGDPDHNLYKSLDRGATWVRILTQCLSHHETCVNANNIGFSVFAVDPLNPQVILAGNQALYRTDDGGRRWSQIGHWWGPTIHTDQKVIAFSPTAFGVVYEGNDGGVVKSTDDGRQWTNLNQNLPGALLYSVALGSDGSMMGGTQDNGPVFSDAGAPWDSVFGGDSNHALIDPISNIWAYHMIYTPHSFTRFNRQTRESSNISPSELMSDVDCAFFPTFSMNLSSPTHLIAACQHLVRTLDATASPVTWTTIGASLADPNQPPDGYGNYVTAAYQAPSDSNVIYAVRGWNTVFVTSNADQGDGAIWTQVTQENQPGAISTVTVDPTDARTAYLACNSEIYKTTDMGASWTHQGVPNLIYHDIAIDPANPQHIFAASNAGVLASTDGGVSWGNISGGIPAGMVVSSLSFNAVSRQLAASTFGRGVYILDLATQ